MNNSEAYEMPMPWWSNAPQGRQSMSARWNEDTKQMEYPEGYAEWMGSMEPGIENDYSLLFPSGTAMLGQSFLPYLNLLKRSK
jgi:hypothetical protein